MPIYPLKGAGITKLSELTIDADKLWQQKGISDIKEVALNMEEGDIPVRNAAVITKLVPGQISYVLTSAGPGHIPTWQPAQSALEKYFPATFSKVPPTAVIATVDRTADKVAAPATSRLDQLAPTFSPEPGAVDASMVVAVDRTADKTSAPATAKTYVVMDAVGGAVADDGGVETDETVAANNDTLNDMILLPAVPVVGDAYDLGYAATFPALYIRQDTLGSGVWTITWKYWNGAWVNLAGVSDEGSGFRPTAAGRYKVSFTLPGDWALKLIQGKNLYWVRAEVTAYTSITAQPKGTRAYIQTASG